MTSLSQRMRFSGLFALLMMSGVVARSQSTILPKLKTADRIGSKSESSEGARFNLGKWSLQTATDFKAFRPAAFPQSVEQLQSEILGLLRRRIAKVSIEEQTPEKAFKEIYSSMVSVITRYDKANVQAPFEEADALEALDKTGELEIETEPASAEVMIDGYQGYGPTATSAFLSEGVHRITITKSGYQDLKEDIKIEARKINRLQRKLVKK